VFKIVLILNTKIIALMNALTSVQALIIKITPLINVFQAALIPIIRTILLIHVLNSVHLISSLNI